MPVTSETVTRDGVPILMNTPNIAKHFGISTATVSRLLDLRKPAKDRRIESVKLGHSRMIYVESVYRYINNNKD